MFTIVDLLCESRAGTNVSLEANDTKGTSLTGLESLDSVLPPNTALLHTTPRRTWVIPVMGVYPNQPGLYLGGEAVGSSNVLRPQACSKTVFARICQKQAFSFLLIHQPPISRAPKTKGV
jgi:hypothetical protein